MQFGDAERIIRSRMYVVVAVLLVGVVAAFVAWKLAKPTYEATSTVMMDGQGSSGSSDSSGSFLATDMPSILLGDTVLTRFVAKEHLKTPLKNLRKAITADVLPNSAIMSISFKEHSARAAIDGANELAEELHAAYREIATRRYDVLANYLSTALDGERTKIEAADRHLGQLVASDPYFTQNDAAQAIGAQLLALDQQRDEVDATMRSHAVAADLAGRRIGDLRPTINAELRNANADYSSLAAQIAKDKSADTVLQAQYTSKYNGIQSLEDQIQRSLDVLSQERKRAEAEDPGNSPTYGALIKDRDTASAVYQGDEAQLAAIEKQIQSTEAQLTSLPNIGVRIAAIRRDRDAANTAYQILAEQRTLTLSEQAQAAALGSVEIVDRAAVAEPSIGKLAILVPIAAFMAFVVLALSLPFALELVDERLRRRVTIETLYGRPLLGRVPA